MPLGFIEGSNSRISKDSKDNTVLTSMMGLQTFEHDLCLIKQMNVLTVFYFINIFVEILLNLLGNDAIKEGALVCASKNFLIIHNEIGGFYMMFYSANVLLSSLVMQIVFYHMPVRFNLVTFSKFGQQKVNVEDIKVSKSYINIEDGLDEMI